MYDIELHYDKILMTLSCTLYLPPSLLSFLSTLPPFLPSMDSSVDQNPSPSPPPSRVKIAGAWCGVLELRLDEWTVPMLRAEVSRRLCGDRPPECVKLISGGKVLRDETGTLLQAGVKSNGKVLASRVEPTAPGMVAEEKRAMAEEIDEEERTRRLSRIRYVKKHG